MQKEELWKIQLPKFREDLFRQIKDNWNQVAKPLDGMGVLEELLCRVGAVQQETVPALSPRGILILCADNGIVAEGVSQSGQEVTLAVARNMGMHKSSVCKMAEQANVEILPVDIGIASEEQVPGVLMRKIRKGTRDFLVEPAMTEEETLKAIETGMDLVKECASRGLRILATGEMGIGNTTTSTALAAALLSLDPLIVTGRGAGLSDAGLNRKTQVIQEALKKYAAEAPVSDEKENAFWYLRCLGGFDIAGLCGVFIGGALYHVPVIIDGVISAVAALCAQRLVPGTKDFMLASHIGAEPAMEYLLQELSLTPIIHAGLKLGEGTGAVMLFPLLDMAREVYQGSNSFAAIGMEQYERYGK